MRQEPPRKSIVEKPGISTGSKPKQRRSAPIFLAAALLLTISIGFVYRVGLVSIRANQEMAKELSVLRTLERFNSSLKDAETGQRGFLLTGEDIYLEPYRNGLSQLLPEIDALRQNASPSDLPKDRVERTIKLTQERLAELDQTIAVRKAKGLEAALKIMRSDRGKATMDQIRSEVSEMETIMENQFNEARRRAQLATLVRNLAFVGAGLLNLFFLFWASRTISREMALRDTAVSENSRQKELLATTLKSIGDGVITTDHRGRITFMNPVAENLIGLRQQEVFGHPLTETFKIIDEITHEAIENPVERVLREGQVAGLSHHAVLISRSGKEIPIDDSAAPIRDSDGNMIGVVLIFRDVAQQRAAELTERKLAAIIEHSDDAIYCTDLGGTITSWNRTAETMFGYSAAEAVGQPVSILVPPDESNEEWQILERIRRGEKVEHYETTRRRKNGSAVEISLTISLLKEPATGQIIGVSKVARDITERKRTQEAAREAEERYRSLFNAMDEGFCVIEMIFDTDNQPLDYRFIEVNPAFEKQSGIKNVLGKRAREISPQREKHWFEAYGKVALTGEPVRFENRADDHWFDVYAFRIGQPEERRVAVLFDDITGRKRTDEALAASVAKFRLVVEGAPNGIVMVNERGIIVMVNMQMERLFGYERDEMLGQRIEMLLPDRFRAGHPTLRQGFFHSPQARPMGQGRDLFGRRKDGSEFPVEIGLNPADTPEGKFVLAAVVDITERKRTEEIAREAGERYQTLFNSMDEGFCVVEMIFDADHQPQDYRFLEVNPAFEKQTGIKDGLGKRMRELEPEHEESWFEIYGKVALTGEPIRFQNRAAALHRWYDVYAYRVGQPEERKVAILFNDITARKKTNDALAKAKDDLQNYAHNLEAMVNERTARLQQTVADLEAFSFTISHDLRSPLRAMQGFAQAALEEYGDKLDAQGKEYLERIAKASVRLDNLIQDVLTFSRVGRTDLSIEPVNLEKLVEEVIQTYPAVHMPHAEITVQHPLHPVLASHASLVQCVSNLLTNAVKFVPARANAKIQVRTERHNGTVQVFIEDNGIGIPENLLGKIFEPFQRGHPHAGYEGTGMGLAIVRKSIERMGGAIGVESRVGQGSTFWLELPAAE